MRKLIVLMHISLDGFAAGPKGEMDWIKLDPDMFDFIGEMTDRADAALYGRPTWQMMDAYWPKAAEDPNASKHDKEHSAWYNKVTKYVMSRTLDGKGLRNTTVISDNLAENILKIKQQPGKDIMIFGSPSASHVLTALGLIDDYWLFVNPVLLGKGIPMFKNVPERMNLKLVESKTFSVGVIGLHYSKA
jgi:dihydrofolate reductase